MAERTGNILQRLVLWCAAAFLAVASLQSGLTAVRGSMGGVLLGVVYAALVLAGAFGIALLLKPGHKSITGAIFLFRFCLTVLLSLVLQTQPVSDFARTYTAAHQLVDGSKAYLQDFYLVKWPYQTGYVIYESLFVRLFGDNLFPLQLVNAIWMGGIGVLVYCIGCKLLPQKYALAGAILYALYPAPYFMAAVLSNQHIGCFLYYLAIYLAVRKTELTPLQAGIVGALTAFGNVLRPEGIVFVAAFLVWRVITAIRDGWKRWKTELAGIVAFCLAWVILGSIVSGAVIAAGVHPDGLRNNTPYWKFLVGLNQDSNGGWSQADTDNYLMLPEDEMNEAMLAEIGRRLQAGPIALAKLALRKSQVLWGGAEDLFWQFGHMDQSAKLGPVSVGQILSLLTWGDKGFYEIVLLLALAGAVFLALRKESSGQLLYPAVLFCGFYAVYLLIEVQVRYRYTAMPALFLLAAAGVQGFEGVVRRSEKKGTEGKNKKNKKGREG